MSNETELYAVLDDIHPLVQARLPQRLGTRETLLQQLHDQRSRVLVFGAYNAGKSSLVNTLTGRELALVGDVPTTCASESYPWDERILIDTPGVNAPVAHEAVAEDALHGAQLVLLVVREGDQDVADVYERLFDLLQAGKPVFLVINHQLIDASQAEQLRARMIEILIQQAERRACDFDVLETLPVLLLNVGLALKGRLQNNPAFLHGSGFPELIGRLQQWLTVSERERDTVKRVADITVRELLLPLVMALEADHGPAHSAMETSEGLARLERRLSRFQQSCETQLFSLIRQAKPAIGAQFDGFEGKQETLEAGISDILETTYEQMTRWLEEQLKPICSDLDDYLARSGLPGINLQSVDQQNAARLGELGDKLGKMGVEGLRAVKPEHIVKALLEGRKLKIGVLKGKWERTFGVWAKKAMPWIQAAAALLEVGLALREQSRHNNEARKAVMQRQQWINETAASLQRVLWESLLEVLDGIEDRLLQPLRAQHATVHDSLDQVRRDALRLRAWMKRLEADNIEITGQLSADMAAGRPLLTGAAQSA